MNKNIRLNHGRVAVTTLVTASLLLGVVTSAKAEELTGFYEDKSPELLVAWNPGGGTDTWARFITSNLPPFLGEDVDMQVVNRPGGGGVLGANEFVLRTENDGMTFLVQSAGQVFPQMYGSEAVRYNFRELTPIAAQAQGGVVYARSDLGFDEIDELWDMDNLVYGEMTLQNIGATALVAFALLDLPIQAVFGYQSRGPIRVAFEQGETNIDYQSTSAYSVQVQPLVDEGIAVPLFTAGVINSSGELVRDPAFPDIPTVKDIYEDRFGETPSGVGWDAYLSIVAAASHKMLWAKQDAPEDSVHDMQQAFLLAQEDEEFMAASEETNGPYPWLVGEDAYNSVRSSLEVSEETIDYVRNTFKERYGEEL